MTRISLELLLVACSLVSSFKSISAFLVGRGEFRLITQYRLSKNYSVASSEHEEYSHIRCIKSRNLAGVVGNEGVSITFQAANKLIAFTGETGIGKSLIIIKTAELLCGGKALASLVVADTDTAQVEMEIVLREPHLTANRRALEQLNVPAGETLLLQRTLLLTRKSNGKPRLKSICRINNVVVALKDLAAVARPLLAIVDASTAATALARPEARMSILDTAVRVECLQRVASTQASYRKSRQVREQLNEELASRVLPSSLSQNGEKDVELLDHWINELDAFEKRLQLFCETLAVSLEVTDDSEDSVLARTCKELSSISLSRPGKSFNSKLFDKLVSVRDQLISLDKQISSARAAVDLMSSLSMAESAVTAVEKARKCLFDAAGTAREQCHQVNQAAEQAHDLLNEVEEALARCSSFLEDDDDGLLRRLEMERMGCPIASEDLDQILLDWKTLARKHGIPSASLPACHSAIKDERDGNHEARLMLPTAIADEQEAEDKFADACRELSKERLLIAKSLSASVTSRLPSLGMAKSSFSARLEPAARKCTDHIVYKSSGNVGTDCVDFVLLHESKHANNGASVDLSASSGEKARLLLAIECALPGSVGASCRTSDEGSVMERIPPVAVMYDEIDAHVGGNAAVSVARMLALSAESNQVFAITHSASVAAIADLHVVVSKTNEESKFVRVQTLDVPGRTKELARMASGDLAVTEAEASLCTATEN
jgi:DNA repair ATPase RecN